MTSLSPKSLPKYVSTAVSLSSSAKRKSHVDGEESLSSFFGQNKKPRNQPKANQLLLTGNSVDENALTKMDTALVVLTHSLGFSFEFPSNPLMVRVLEVARILPPAYVPPSAFKIGGQLPDKVYSHANADNLLSLLNQASKIGLTIFGDGATIVKSPLVNILAAGVKTPSAMMDIVDCTHHCSRGYKKDERYLTGEFVPVINKIHNDVDAHGRKCRKAVQLITFDGAINFQKAAKTVVQTFPWMKVIHSAEHTVSLFFSDLFEKVMVYCVLSTISKNIRDVFCSTRHVTGAMFQEKEIEMNGQYIGCIQPFKCR